jgi:hypothetical protein
MTPANAATFPDGGIGPLEELKAFGREIASALIGRLDDHDLLVKLNTRSELTFARVDQLVTSIEQKQDNLDTRVDKLEKTLAMVYGGAFVLSLLGSGVGYLIGFMLRGGKS